jgi:hypothetical protein
MPTTRSTDNWRVANPPQDAILPHKPDSRMLQAIF